MKYSDRTTHVSHLNSLNSMHDEIYQFKYFLSEGASSPMGEARCPLRWGKMPPGDI